MKRRHFLAVTAGVVGSAVAEARLQRSGGAAAKAVVDVSWLTRLPKVELHVHIEGAIPKPALWQLVTKYGGDPTVPTFEAFDWATGFVREAEDFAFIGREIAHHFSRQNIRYVEAHFSPTVFRQRLTPQVIAEALCKGLDQVPAVDVRLVAELGRNLGPDGALRTVELVPVVVDRSWLETHVLQARRLVPVATKRGRRKSAIRSSSCTAAARCT